jgi:hypothetical protein
VQINTSSLILVVGTKHKLLLLISYKVLAS